MNNKIVAGFDEGKEVSLKMELEKIEQVPNCIAVHLTGYIDAYNHHYFQKQVAKLLDAGFTRLMFDLRDISFIGSTGVGGLVNLMNTLRARAGDLVLQDVQGKVHEVFQLLGYSRFFLASNGLAESIALLSPKPAPAAFPRVFRCPVCEVKLRAPRAGRFRCSHCRTTLVLDEAGTENIAPPTHAVAAVAGRNGGSR